MMAENGGFKSMGSKATAAPGFGRSLGCLALRLVGFLSCLRVVGASSASAPGPSSSAPPQISSPYPTVWYVGVGATIVGTESTVILFGVKLYNHLRERRRDSVRGVVDELARTFLKSPRGTRMRVGRLSAGEASVDDFRLESLVEGFGGWSQTRNEGEVLPCRSMY